jgi:hypothetical protein
MFKGLVVTGPDCEGTYCARSKNVRPDYAGPNRTCTAVGTCGGSILLLTT